LRLPPHEYIIPRYDAARVREFTTGYFGKRQDALAWLSG
jgi:hypothetical protein